MAIGKDLEPIERQAARERQGTRTDIQLPGKLPGSEQQSLERVSGAVGMSRPTDEKASAVVDAAAEEPEIYGEPAAPEDSRADRARCGLQRTCPQRANR